MSFPLALLLVALSGFISLSYEILWYRVFSFTSMGSPSTFGVLLGAFLLGIAFGSLGSRRFCTERVPGTERRILVPIALFVFCANLVGWLVIPLLGWVSRFGKWGWVLPVVGLAAGLLGATFPLISHFGIPPDDKAGARLSYLYMANIVGSCAGSLLTGFVLMDLWQLRTIALFLALTGTAVAAGLLLPARLGSRRLLAGLCVAGVAAAGFVGLTPRLFHEIYEKLMWHSQYSPGKFTFAEQVETRSGVVSVARDGTIYGGGVYDGIFTTDVVHKDQVIRPYAISALHAAPRQVFMIGLASGSWAQIVANNQEVEHLTVVEINPGYLEVIAAHPEVASILTSPKVTIVLDDGRRWLQRHPERKFDLIVANTTYNWRAHATNVLSTEFLELARSRLAPGGIYYFNTTDSADVARTGAAAFPYALRVLNFLALSDTPITFDRERWRAVLTEYRIDGRPVFELDRPADAARLEEILALAESTDRLPGFRGLQSREGCLERFAGGSIITDDNMVTEWHEPLKR